MSSDMRWRIRFRNLETRIRIGLHDHEKEPQRIIVNVLVEGHYPYNPGSVKECFNYDHVHSLVVKKWPQQPHKLLLEHCVVELLEHIFSVDDRVEYAKVSVSKPDIFPDTEAVEVEGEWTRADFEKIR